MKKLLALILTLALLTSSALAFDFSFFGKKVTAEAPTSESAEAPASEPASEPAEAAAAYAKFEGAGYASPEEAALAYVEALKNQDAIAALSTFAIESYVDNADFDAHAERLKAFMLPSYTGMIPTENAYFCQVQVFQRLAAISDYMMYAYLNGIWDRELLGEDFLMPVRINDEVTAEAVRESFAQGEAEFGFDQIEVLGTIDIHELDAEVAETYAGERVQEMLAKICRGYGGDEVAETIMQLRINGVDYLQFMQCIRYGDAWYNLTPMGYLASMTGLDSLTGGLIPVDALYE